MLEVLIDQRYTPFQFTFLETFRNINISGIEINNDNIQVFIIRLQVYLNKNIEVIKSTLRFKNAKKSVPKALLP